ncbi:DEAD/DEAH box helicase [Dietzia sp. WMMA184]|uniref:DEAD/DEAH box helicase n=1 Tax=Dietzia sp. WMMA184 TaxID=2039808 RepID=UPI000BDEA1A4|nr:DEAD/DEAH box helicase [Dietzia sp. WMMA184]
MTTYGRELLGHLLEQLPAGASPLTRAVDLPAREARHADWPAWAHPGLVDELRGRGVERPWAHQVATAEHAHAGRNVVVATGTASGKSLGYQLPALSALAADPGACVLYLAPTKALGQDQLSSVISLVDAVPELSHVAPASYDGDTPTDARPWIRENSRWIVTNPDMLHLSLLGRARQWTRILRGLRFVVVDECHSYRGVFGSNVALVLRRLDRLARALGAAPTYVLASATTSDAGVAATTLVGRECVEVTEDASPQGGRTVALWEPPLMEGLSGEHGAPVRRPAPVEASTLMASLVAEGARTLTFVRSRAGAESTALRARERLASEHGERGRELAGRIAAYRAGYLADDRRELERGLAEGELVGVASTSALELGVDISGLDAVVSAGFPGTIASFWQQAGRAGRRGQGALVMLVARDDPLDTYLVHHPDALLGRPVEATVTDPRNPVLLAGQLRCAVSERPMPHDEARAWGATDVLERLAADGLVRRRPAGWYPAADDHTPHAEVDIRGTGGAEVVIVDAVDGRMLGTIDSVRARSQVHPGALYLHQGESFVVDELNLEDGLALCHPEVPDWTTSAREQVSIDLIETLESVPAGPVTLSLADVEVTTRVTGYQRRLRGGEILDVTPLDLPETTLATRAVVYTLTPQLLRVAGLEEADWPGALHAAEHAAIGLLPLVATCDRWDIGGVSTALHPDTGLPTVFVYDGYSGGAGFAERGFRRATAWLGATLAAIRSCECESGCPSCIQSPKCGNGNDPLSKPGAIALLTEVVGQLGGVGVGEPAPAGPAAGPR